MKNFAKILSESSVRRGIAETLCIALVSLLLTTACSKINENSTGGETIHRPKPQQEL